MADYWIPEDMTVYPRQPMEIYLLDRNLAKLGVVSEYESLVWTTRTWDHHTANLKCNPATLVSGAAFLQRSDTSEAMLITRINSQSDGREYSCEIEARGASILLAKRVNWWTHDWSGADIATCISDLITDAQATQDGVTRTIAKMGAFVDESAAYAITKQVSWGSCSDAIYNLVREAGYGFGVRYLAAELIPYAWSGTDRSASVIFCDEWGDVSSCTVDRDTASAANMAVIGGEGEGAARVVETVTVSDGLELAELWVDANDVKKTGEGGVTLSDAQYAAALQQRGSEKLAEAPITYSFEAKVTQDRFSFRRDYFLGDTVAWRALGYTGTDILSEVTETFEGGEISIELGLGKTAPTIKKLVTFVAK